MEAADRVDSAPTLTLEALEAQLTELAAHIYAGTYRWLCLLREFDERGGWHGWGRVRCDMKSGCSRQAQMPQRRKDTSCMSTWIARPAGR